MKKKKIIIIVVIAAAVIALICALATKASSSGSDSSAKVFVQSVSAVCKDSGSANRYNGIVEEQEKSKLEFDTSRTLKSVNVKEGDHVKTGDVLFAYDTESIELEIEQLNLELDKLNTELTNNNAQLTQLNNDMANASESDRLEYTSRIAQTQADIAQGQYDIKTKQAEIKKKQAQVTASSITSPIDGTVSDVADVDSIINGTNVDSTGSISNVYITIVKDGNLRIKGTISENNIADIKTGEKVTLLSRIDSTKTWEGEITSINTSSTTTTNNSYYYSSSSGESASKYNFYVDLDSADDLIIGQHVLIYSAETAKLKDGLWLDSGWICTDEDGSYYVWTSNGGNSSLAKTEVTLGTYLEDLDVYEILSGITEDSYIAWPDSDCHVGAKTTTEAVTETIESESTEALGASEEVMTDTDAYGMTEDEAVGTESFSVSEDALSDGTISDGEVQITSDGADDETADSSDTSEENK